MRGAGIRDPRGQDNTWTGSNTFSGAVTFAGTITASSVIQAPDGAVGAPAYTFSATGQQDVGRYRIGADNVGEAVGGALVLDWNGARVNVAGHLYVDSDAGVLALGAGQDVTFARKDPASLRIGDPDEAGPTAYLMQIGTSARDGTDTDTAGGNATINTGIGTGAGAVSSLIFQTPTAHGSDAVAQTLNTRLTVTEASATFVPKVVLTTPAVTVGTGTGLTVNETALPQRVVYKVTLDYTGLAAVALTADHTICTLPAKTRVLSVISDTTTPYTGGAVSAATMMVGPGVASATYLVDSDVLSGAVQYGLADADLGTDLIRAGAIMGGHLPNWSGTTVISVRLTTVDANTNVLTAGSTTFYISTEQMP